MHTIICGIYKIENKISGLFIIGSSNNIKRRWNEHKNRLKRDVHENKYLQRAYNKYGPDAFEFSIIEECPEDILIEREQYWIDWCRHNNFKIYNFGNCAKSPMLGKKLSEETKKKISISNTGKKRSKESKELMSKNHADFKGKKSYWFGKHPIPWNKGKKCPQLSGELNGSKKPEARLMISLKMKGNQNGRKKYV